MTGPRTAPPPSNAARLQWRDLPPAVHSRLEELAGAGVVGVEGATQGFSPGFAGLLTLADGRRIFAKAMSAEAHPHSIFLNRQEAEVLAQLPPDVPAPRLLWAEEDPWHLMGIEPATGGALDPQNACHLRAAWDLYSRIAAVDASAVRVAGEPLEPFEEALADLFDRWARLFAEPDAGARIAALGDDAQWVRDHRDILIQDEAAAAPHTRGSTLVHADLRLDNMVLSASGEAVAVDWAWACIGAPHLDLAAACCSLAVQTGRPADELFRSHPLSGSTSPEAVRAAVTVLAGYFTHQAGEPEPPSLPGLREFQRAQVGPALAWLRALEER